MSDTQPINDIATLERRLTDGWTRIEQARADGQDITAWTDFWIELLHQYEAACDAVDPISNEEGF